ncbi:MAG: 3-ketoacyl-ACP reductase [Christensenellales bacterium]|jgi:3-oxoacyl-[acyl-carrier protein] reductase
MKRALVTGGTRGIGRAIAERLRGGGWEVVVSARTPHEVPGIRCIQADNANAADRTRLLHEAGEIDLLVNNAGIAPRARADILEMSEASMDEVMRTNLYGPFFLTQQAAKGMIGRGGMIINISSVSAYAASVERGEYCISKAGIAMMTQLFAVRLAAHDIPVYEIRPGVIRTDMTGQVTAKYDKLIAGGLTPIARWGEPADVAEAVAVLAEGRLKFSTGEVVNVDGGFHLRRL